MDLANNSRPNFSDICEAVQTDWPPQQWTEKHVMVAVSGGADSVLLLRALHQLHIQHMGSGELTVCHVDHGTRESSAKDAHFVHQLASQQNLKFTSKITPAIKPEALSEEAMRQERYLLFMEMADALGARYLATGHNQDDQIETALFRIFRGTGFKGLSGIPALRVQDAVSIVRPLLPIPRSKILAALKEIDQPFCTDESNHSSNYTRNFLRNDILPDLRQRFPGFDNSILNLMQQANEFDHFLDHQIQHISQAVVHVNDNEIRIAKPQLKETAPILIRQLLMQAWQEHNWPRKDMNRKWWEQLCDLAQDTKNRSVLNLPGNIRVESEPRELRLLNG